MANLIITEHKGHGHLGNGNETQAAIVPEITTQVVTIGASSTQSAVLNAQTRLVHVEAGADCHILFGTNPTATTGKRRLLAGVHDYFTIDPSVDPATIKVAVIEA